MISRHRNELLAAINEPIAAPSQRPLLAQSRHRAPQSDETSASGPKRRLGMSACWRYAHFYRTVRSPRDRPLALLS